MAKFRIQPHVRLQEWVAEENGFFADEGLDYEFETAGFAGGAARRRPRCSPPTPRRWRCAAARSRTWSRAAPARLGGLPLGGQRGRDREPRQDVGQGVLGVRVGHLRGARVALSQRPEDLAGVEVGVGFHSGSHYSAIQGLEPFLARDADRARVRGPAVRPRPADARAPDRGGERVRRPVLPARAGGLSQARRHDVHDGLPGQRGRRHRGPRALLPRDAPRPVRARPRARALQALWLREIPEDLLDAADVRRFGTGERIVFEPYTREMFERTHRWMEQWDLFDAGAARRAELRGRRHRLTGQDPAGTSEAGPPVGRRPAVDPRLPARDRTTRDHELWPSVAAERRGTRASERAGPADGAARGVRRARAPAIAGQPSDGRAPAVSGGR